MSPADASAPTTAVTAPAAVREPARRVGRRPVRFRPAFGAGVAAALFACAVAPGAIATTSPTEQSLAARLRPPAWMEGGAPGHVLGTDGLGRDLFSRIIYGGRISLTIGLVGVAISFTLGTLVGSFVGYVGGWIDNLTMRLVEVEMSLPSFYFLLALAAVIPTWISSAMRFLLIVAIMSLISWAGFARIIRGMVSSLREGEYVIAARALGASRWRIVTRHLIPGTFSYTIVAATLAIPGFILGESALSLLGLGIQEPGASWGNLLAEAQNVQNLTKYPWILIPGVFIFATIMAFNFLGDFLRDRLDPRAAQR